MLSLLFALFVAYTAGRDTYDGQQVLKCNFNPQPHQKTMQQILDTFDIWGILADQTIDIRVKTPDERKLLESLLPECTVLIEDLEAEVQKFDEVHLAAREKFEAAEYDYSAETDPVWWTAYHTLAELNAWYRNITSTYAFVTSTDIGVTSEGNAITAYTINPSGNRSNPIVYLDAGIHAREWIAPATLNYCIDRFIKEYQAGVADTKALLDKVQLVVIGDLNPDGYLWSWSNDRMWRKNRMRYSGQTCYGVDENRNFASHWGQGGSSTSPCSDTYMGPSAGSEAEVKAVSAHVSSLQSSTPKTPIIAYVSYHSYSQLILRPWGWTSANSPNETYLNQLGTNWSNDIFNVSQKTYKSQKSNALYITTGSSSDYMYDDTVTNANIVNGANYRVASYTIELRPQEGSSIGFQLPPAEILPTGQENYPALKKFLISVQANPVYKTG